MVYEKAVRGYTYRRALSSGHGENMGLGQETRSRSLHLPHWVCIPAQD